MVIFRDPLEYNSTKGDMRSTQKTFVRKLSRFCDSFCNNFARHDGRRALHEGRQRARAAPDPGRLVRRAHKRRQVAQRGRADPDPGRSVSACPQGGAWFCATAEVCNPSAVEAQR